MRGGRTAAIVAFLSTAAGGSAEEGGERVAHLVRALHRHEVAGAADGAERARRQTADRLRGLALAEAGALLAADDERLHGEVLEEPEAVAHGRLRVDLRLDLARAEELHLAVGAIPHAMVDVEADELLLPGLEGHAPPERGEHDLPARPHVAPPARGAGGRALPRGLLPAGGPDEHRLDRARA